MRQNGQDGEKALSTVNYQLSIDPGFDDGIFEEAARELLNAGGYSPEMLSDNEACRNLIKETFRVLESGVSKGLGTKPDPDLAAALRENVFVFSGFKTHAELEQAAQLITDEKGFLKPFNQFLNDAKTINAEYNHNYLRSEYNQAVQSAQIAAKWHDVQSRKNLVNLQYRTANDERVRAEHRRLHGVTLPVDDKFWKQFTPPLGWNCRCTIVEVLKDDYPESDSQGSIAIGERITEMPKDRIFRFNPGIEKSVFPKKHPYLPKSCNSCPLNNGKQLAGTGGKKDCGKDCKVFKGFKEKVEGKAENDKNTITNKNRIAKERAEKAAEGVGTWRVSKENPRLQINSKADKTEIKENTRCALSVIKSFPVMELGIRPHIISKDGIKNPEFISGKDFGDRKGITGFDSVKDEIKKALKQGCQFVIIDLDEHNLIPKINDLKNDIKNRIADFESGILKAVYVVFNDKAVVITKDHFIKGKDIAGEKIKKTLNRLL